MRFGILNGLPRPAIRATAETCQMACAADNACRAFTYNVNARWCFPRSAEIERKSFEGAISGLLIATGGGELPELGGAALGPGPAPALAYVPRHQLQEARTLPRNLARAARLSCLRKGHDDRAGRRRVQNR